MAIKDYSTDPDQNVKISGINIAEGCAPSGINNAIRQLMADVKEEQEARTTEDAAQDTAISNAATAAANAQTSANAAQQSANAAQSTADSALAAAEEAKDAAANITVPVTSVNGQTGAVTVGTVRSVNGVSADAAGNVAVNISAPVTSVNGMTGAVTISSVSTATSATTTPNVAVWTSIRAVNCSVNNGSITLPSGGTWRYMTWKDGDEGSVGDVAGGSKFSTKYGGIAIRIS